MKTSSVRDKENNANAINHHNCNTKRTRRKLANLDEAIKKLKYMFENAKSRTSILDDKSLEQKRKLSKSREFIDSLALK